MSKQIFISDFHVIAEGQARPVTIVRAIYTNLASEVGSNLFDEVMSLVSSQAAAYIKENFGDEAKSALPAEGNDDSIPRAIRVLPSAVEVNWLVWGGTTP